MTTVHQVDLGVLGPLTVRQYGLPVAIPGAKPRALLTMLGLHGGSVVAADTLLQLLWGDEPPRTAAKALQTHVSALRRSLGDGFVLTEGTGWTLSTTEIDASRYKVAAKLGRDAFASGDASQAAARFNEALALWRGVPELPDGTRGTSEKTRWIEGHAALVEDRADALLATGRAAELIGDLEAAVGDAPLRERRWGQLMLALYRAGRQGEALSAFQRARALLADELGVDPGPDLRRLEAAIVAQDDALETPVSERLSSVTRAVTFLLTDIEGSTAAWEAQSDAMAVALARHDEIVEQVVTSRGGRLIKTRGEGDATFSVFDRPSAAAAAAIELQEAIRHEPWELLEPMRLRVALHTGEVELRDGDYFGRAVNRAARLRSLAAGGQILCSGATAELAIDSLADDVMLVDLGMRQLKNLPRPEHVFELRLQTADELQAVTPDRPMERPALPAVLTGPGPFVGRGHELERLLSTWQTALAGGAHAMLIAGEPGVGKTRLAGEWSRHAYEQEAIVLYGRCDEDLGAPYQPFAEALRALIPSVGASRLRGLRGIEALLSLVPGLTDVLPDLAAPTRADPDTERYALFDAVVAVLGVASASAPVVLILDDLHWATKPTLLLLRHLLRFGEHARVQIVGTYRSTDLDRSHPLAAMLADLNRDGSATRLQLSGLDQVDVSAYLAEAGYDDEELALALAVVTGGNPFFLIEALRHVDESGGRWDPSTLPQGVREAVSRRLSRLPAETNKALAAAAVVGSRFALSLVERVVGGDLIDAFDEASKAGIVIEEPGGRYRFNHAIVRQSLLAELASVRRMRLHQKIAATLETEPGAEDELLAELAHHYFECAWAGNAAKAVDYCRRAADQAMARLGYEGAADLYDRALHALEELDDELPDRDEQQAELLIARCEALLAAGDVVSAKGAVAQLQAAAGGSGRLAAWGTCFDGQLSMLTDPERLDEIESEVSAAAETLAGLDDAAGEAKAHTVRAGCLARLGRIGDCEAALDQALTAARRAQDHRRVNGVLANAPLAALWGPNPVPRAGGRCLDVVRLLRITTGSPVVEAASTRCQAVLDALRGRAPASRSLLDSARRSLTELGMRHALLEVDQFAGIVELVADDPAAAEPHLRRAYTGFRRMGLDVDTAETAALLARTCVALGRDGEADELCTESERLAGHALKASIAWRTVRAQLLARGGDHDGARRMAEEAVTLAGRTDALVDHGDACLALATVLGATGDTAGARAAAEQAVELYELKGAAALAEKARRLLGESYLRSAPTTHEEPVEELDNACVQALRRLDAAFDRDAWRELEEQVAPSVAVESRRKIVGLTREDYPAAEWARAARGYRAVEAVRHRHVVVAVRGERLALTRLEIGTADVSPGAPRDELIQLFGLDDSGRIALQVWFDVEDMDAAIAEMNAAHARFEGQLRSPLENAATRADARFNALFVDRRFDELGELLIDDVRVEDRRRGLHRVGAGRAAELAEVQALVDLGVTSLTSDVIATRGERLALVRIRVNTDGPGAFHAEILRVAEVDADDRIAAVNVFDPDDVDAAIAELDARYLAGEAAPYAHSWSLIATAYAAFNRCEVSTTTPEWRNVDHRRGAAFAPGDMMAYLQAAWDDSPDTRIHIAAVHRLSDLGGVVTHVAHGISQEGFDAAWRDIHILAVEGEMISRSELFDEADLDVALAKFDELKRPAPGLNNAAGQASARYWTSFARRDWDALAGMLADSFSSDDRRRMVGAGVRHGRDAEVADLQAIVDLGLTNASSTFIATRGDRLLLGRVCFSGSDHLPETALTEVLGIMELDIDRRIKATVVFGPNDLEAAFEELENRYLAGEAAEYAETWSVLLRVREAFNKNEKPAWTSDFVDIDHRRGTAFAPGDQPAYLSAAWNQTPDLRMYTEAVHRLTNLGAVISYAAHGTTQEGFEAEWSGLCLVTVEGDALNRNEWFEHADLDAALARFDELSRPVMCLDTAATRAGARLRAAFAARDWDTLAEILADDLHNEDRRRTVNGGIRRGRDSLLNDMRAAADIGVPAFVSVEIATRGERLVLVRAETRYDERPGAFQVDNLAVAEFDAAGRMSAQIVFDLGEIDAAFEELDTRYLAGEAAPHAHTWSVITGALAAVNRHEVPESTPDWVNIDHRRAIAFAPGDMTAYMHATWDEGPDGRASIERVHRLSNLGAIVTQVGHEISPQGFEAEWRLLTLVTVEGDRFNRCEFFDESDLDAALARFDELDRPAGRLTNPASQVSERFMTHFVAGEWDVMAEMLVEGFVSDDRRPVVGAGLRHGRDDALADMRTSTDLARTDVSSEVIAVRGNYVVLVRVRLSSRDRGLEAFHTDFLSVVETTTDNRAAANVIFEPDDLDAAVAELENRYMAGEAAPYAHAWAVVTAAYAATNRHELPRWTSDVVNLDHRRVTAFASGELAQYVDAAWDQTPGFVVYVEAVHRLSSLGAVVTHVARGTAQQGFEGEWREITMTTIDGDLINGSEMFDEEDRDAALAKFDELSRPAPPLENAASNAGERFLGYFAARDWDSMAEILADGYLSDDRRPVVNAGVRQGRDAEIMNMQAIEDLWTSNVTTTVIAIRGGHLTLMRARYLGRDQGPEVYATEILGVIEIDTSDRISSLVVFDPDDVGTAIEELDARYLAGEAAPHAQTWSVIAGGFAAVGRHEPPAIAPDWINIDHRLGSPFTNNLTAILDTSGEVTPDLRSYVETVHQLNGLGAVFTQRSYGTSHDGFDAEWRMIDLVTVEGGLLNRCELFDEEDLDAALAKFDELSRPVARLRNAASQVYERFWTSFAASDWVTMATMLATDTTFDDRRRVVNAGIRRGRDAGIADMRAIAELWNESLMTTLIAIRGDRLALSRVRSSATESELLNIVEINDDNGIAALVAFDLEDIDAAFAELEARYLAGEAAEYAATWSVVAGAYAAYNRHDRLPTAPDVESVDRRRLAPFAAGELITNVEASWEMTPNLHAYVSEVVRLSGRGAVVSDVAHGTSSEGFNVEWREVNLLMVDGDMVTRCEIFDEEDPDAALARFDELAS